MNKKSTKKALITSALCLMLCMSMLVGTTFAWFTDAVSSNNNVITAGNLDVNLYWSTDGVTWLAVTETTNVFKEDTYWEPGHTEVVYLRVVNEGSLALKYDLVVNVAGEVSGINGAGQAFNLSDYILYNVYDGIQTYADSTAARGDESGDKLNVAYNKASQLLDQGDEVVLTMVVFMPSTVGNEANSMAGATLPTISLGLNLFATQFTKEEDSFGAGYDNDANYVVATPETIQDVIDDLEADQVALLLPGDYHTTIVAKSDITIKGAAGAVVDCINLNGSKNVTLKNIAFDAAGAQLGYDGAGNGKQYANIITGDATNKPNMGAMNLVIDGCTFTGTFANGGAAIAFTDQKRSGGFSGNITISNCTFDTEGAYYDIYGYYCGDSSNGHGEFVMENNLFRTEFTLGLPVYLGRYASGTAVVVKGNTFETVDSLENAVYVQDHSSYGVSVDAADNIFAG